MNPLGGHSIGIFSKVLAGLFSPENGRGSERPIPTELLSVERLEEEARALAARFTIDPRPRRGGRNAFRRLDRNAKALGEAYRTFLRAAQQGEFIPSGADWLLDNYPVVASAIRDVRHSLPRGYHRELPKLALRGRAGQARVH